MNPYSNVATPVTAAPLLRASENMGQQLVFRAALGPGAIAFAELPFIEDAVLMISQGLHHQRHNDRPAWSIVEQCLARLPPAHLSALLASGYASGLIEAADAWEAGGDDRALAYMVAEYKQPPDLVRRLYDVVATNNLVSRLFFMPLMPSHRAFFLLLSRANHSCVPTAALECPIGQPGPTVVRTLRAVEAGTPLTIDYAAMEPEDTKRRFLAANFGFRCACVRCAPLCGVLDCPKRGTGKCTCGKAHYCSVEHQRLDWLRHKKTEHSL